MMVSFYELPPYPVRSYTYRNEQVRTDEVERVIGQTAKIVNECLHCTLQANLLKG
jgi:hypothetical protein